MKDNLVAQKNDILEPMLGFNLEERRLLAFCLQHYNSMPDADNSNVFVEVTPEAIQETYPDLANKKPNYILDRFSKACNSMQTKPYIDPADPMAKTYWFDSIRALEDGGFRFTLTKSIEPYFLNLSSHFIRYSLQDVAQFNKPASWNLYEYLKEKFLDGKCKDWTVTVEDLKERLGVTDKYIGRFGNFDTKCIKRPLEEINGREEDKEAGKKAIRGSDLYVRYKKIKKGVTVIKIRFEVEKRKWREAGVIDGETSAERIKNGLLSEDLKRENIENWIAIAQQNNMLLHLDKDLPRIIHESKGKGVKNRKGYIVNSVKRIIAGKGQPNLFETKTKSDKMTLERCRKERGPNCPYRLDNALKPLFTFCVECRE